MANCKDCQHYERGDGGGFCQQSPFAMDDTTCLLRNVVMLLTICADSLCEPEEGEGWKYGEV